MNETAALLDQAAAVAGEVLAHPEHRAGIDALDMTIVGIDRPAPGIVRITGRLGAVGDLHAWRVPNVAVRLAIPDAPGRPASRVYTVRRLVEHDGATAIEIDVVVHPEPSPAMRWLERVAVGGRIEITGPRAHVVPDAGLRPLLLLADATAVPALHAILAQWPAGRVGHAVVALAEPAQAAELPAVDTVSLDVRAAAPGELLAATQALATAEHSIWGAGERTEMRAIRDLAVGELGIDREHVRVFGYWRSGISGTELDARRVLHLKALLDAGRAMAEFDDFAIDAT